MSVCVCVNNLHLQDPVKLLATTSHIRLDDNRNHVSAYVCLQWIYRNVDDVFHLGNTTKLELHLKSQTLL